jgi:nucleoside-diphosphate-sugar epimerase
MNETKLTLFITGGAGYVGAMLIDQFSDRSDIKQIVTIDKEPKPELLKDKKNLVYIQANVAEGTWQKEVEKYSPDVVIHTAWQIRELYKDQKTQWKWNVDGSDEVFDFAFRTPSVKKLVYFSTVSSYGAFADNSLDHFFTEEELFRKSGYFYAEEKRVAEEHLKEKYEAAKKRGAVPQVFIVRPAAITGPRGRYMRIRFGLQAALSGQLKESFAQRVVSAMVSFVPVTPKWCRQFIHEDDVNDIVALFAFSDLQGSYEVFNICPPGPIVTGKDMADAVGKKTLSVAPWMVRLAFFVMRNVTFGKVPTSKGGWKSYSYPIAVDGSKLTKQYGYIYKHQSKEAFVKKEGRYAKYAQ